MRIVSVLLLVVSIFSACIKDEEEPVKAILEVYGTRWDMKEKANSPTLFIADFNDETRMDFTTNIYVGNTLSDSKKTTVSWYQTGNTITWIANDMRFVGTLSTSNAMNVDFFQKKDDDVAAGRYVGRRAK